MELCLGPSMPLREGQGSDTWPREERVDIARQGTGRRPAVQRAGSVLPCPPGPAQAVKAERTTSGQKDCIGTRSDLTFHSSGRQAAGAAGGPRGSGGAAARACEAIVHQLQVRRVEGVRPRQVRHGREHLPRGRRTGS